jgi:hypothetical protein
MAEVFRFNVRSFDGTVHCRGNTLDSLCSACRQKAEACTCPDCTALASGASSTDVLMTRLATLSRSDLLELFRDLVKSPIAEVNGIPIHDPERDHEPGVPCTYCERRAAKQEERAMRVVSTLHDGGEPTMRLGVRAPQPPAESYAPPDPYAAGLAKLREALEKANPDAAFERRYKEERAAALKASTS